MVKFKFMEKWSKLGRKEIILDDEKPVRVSVGLTEECLTIIDNCSQNMGIFNGKTDFLTTSIREFYYPYVRYANEMLIKLNNQYPEYPAKALEELESEMEKYLDTYITGFNNDFGNVYNKQVSFYVSSDLRTRIFDMECMGKKTHGDVIRAAITYQILRICERYDEREEFIDTFNQTSHRAYGD